MSRYFVTGIGTDVGKTVVSSFLVATLDADYWKPVQCGTEGGTDTEFILSSGLLKGKSYPERYLLQMPQSPHLAAKEEGQTITMEDFSLPQTDAPLVIEGAGGILVPLNEKGDYVIDLALKFDAEVVLVVRHYLGSINHTLLSLDYLKKNGFKVKGIVISGAPHQPTEDIILNQGVPLVGRLSELTSMKISPEDTIKNFVWYG